LPRLLLTKSFMQLPMLNFSKHWESSKLIGNLRRLNPDFYPVAVTVTPNPAPNIKSDFAARKEGFLTATQLIHAHGRCGNLLHAANPFSKGIDYELYQQSFLEWYSLVVGLLNFHLVHLPNEPGFWFIQMGDFSTDEVSYNIFAPFAGSP
jgi:hypothetical protein